MTTGCGGGCEIRDVREDPASTWAERTGGERPRLPWGWYKEEKPYDHTVFFLIALAEFQYHVD